MVADWKQATFWKTYGKPLWVLAMSHGSSCGHRRIMVLTTRRPEGLLHARDNLLWLCMNMILAW